jgi:hypothetical protein
MDLTYLRHLEYIIDGSRDLIFGSLFIFGTMVAFMHSTRVGLIVGYLLLVLWLFVQPTSEPVCKIYWVKGQAHCIME